MGRYDGGGMMGRSDGERGGVMGGDVMGRGGGVMGN